MQRKKSKKSIPTTNAATSIDVAKLAGVSQTSVSRVFNREWDDRVSDELRNKVLCAAEELGYSPNAIARGLIIQKTGIIGIVLADEFSVFYHHILSKLTNAFQQHDMRVMAFNIAPENDINQIITRLNQYQVDGIVITSAAMTQVMSEHWIQSGLPLVVLNAHMPETVCNSVYCDNFGATGQMAKHLYETGKRKFAYVSSGRSRYSDHIQRKQGFLNGLSQLNINDCKVFEGDFSYESGLEAGRTLFSENDFPDAVFCCGELMALGVMDVVRNEFGLRIPEDVAVAGYDDSFAASLGSYQLTAVHQPMDRMVADTTELLLNQINDARPATKSICEPMSIIIRGSTAK
ncbi:MAG: LacI family transcriptional regulator [Oscillospiraceae bacterium]|jgi:DNA-binding LacI/PurR family transcriptional regulator|nr:LacI family transcriptional regulator [Oscillospiraceae bacterium]